MSNTVKRKISEEKVWMKHYPAEAAEIRLPRCTVWQYVRENNRDRRYKTALHYYGTDISYGELERWVDAAADAFAALGVGEGDVVSFLSVGTPETIAAIYALNKLGAAANTIDPRMDVESIRRMVKGCGSRILLTIDIAFPKLRPILEDIGQEWIITVSAADSLPLLKRIAMKLGTRTEIPYGKGIVTWREFLKGGRNTKATEAPYRGDAVVAITYTGGTTGTPKGVMLTNDSMNAVAVNFMHCGISYNKGDRFLGIIPVFSSYGMVCGMHMPLCLSLELVPIPKFVPGEFGKLVKTYRPQHLISTPAFIEMLMESREVEGLDMSFLKTLGSGGDTMNEGLEQKLGQFIREHNMPNPLAQGYGMSELSAAATFSVNEFYKPNSVGIPSLTVTVGIFDPETGEELGYYQQGEVCVTGPSMMKGYWGEPEETAHVMRRHADGQVWIHSGDVGYMDEEGFLYIKGRLKRMITRFDGHKVFPVNLENRIGERPDVRGCAVIGVKDRGHGQGQYPLAVVEPAPGVEPGRLCREIFRDCQENVEERGQPAAVLWVEEIPLTGMGKNDCRVLEERFGTFDYEKWAEDMK